MPTDYSGWDNIDDPLPPGQTWWPVVTMQIEGGTMEMVQHSDGRVMHKVLVICFYQLGESPLTGWWMEVIHHWRRLDGTEEGFEQVYEGPAGE